MTIEEKAQLLADNVAGWETHTLERIGRRIKKYSKMSLTDVKQINNIAVTKSEMRVIMKELAEVTGYNISQIEKMYGDLLAEQHLANMPLYDYRGVNFVPFAENKAMQAIVNAYARTTAETMINLSQTKALCFYDVATGRTLGMEKAIYDAFDKAVMAVSTGSQDFNTVMRDTINTLGGSGIRVNYGGGVTRRLDTVVRQNLLYGAKQASIEYNDMVGKELGCDGYEIDAHSNPRPSHRFMQGKQYCIGDTRRINGELFIGFEAVDPDSEEGKSASEALNEYGCLHYKMPIICGVSRPRYTKEQLNEYKAASEKTYNIDGKQMTGYDVKQNMRRLETAVREQKRERDMARASGDKLTVKKCSEKIKAYKAKYDEIAKIAGISPDYSRMSIPRGTSN